MAYLESWIRSSGNADVKSEDVEPKPEESFDPFSFDGNEEKQPEQE